MHGRPRLDKVLGKIISASESKNMQGFHYFIFISIFKTSGEFALTPPFHHVAIDLHKRCTRANCNQRPIKRDYFRWLFVDVVESL